jgi:hypothetical protein
MQADNLVSIRLVLLTTTYCSSSSMVFSFSLLPFPESDFLWKKQEKD